MNKIIKFLNNKKSVKVRLITPHELATRAYRIAPITSIILLNKEFIG